MDVRVLLAVVVALIFAASALFVMSLTDDSPEQAAPDLPVEPEPEVPDVPEPEVPEPEVPEPEIPEPEVPEPPVPDSGLPEGYSFDSSTGTVSCDHVVDWRVIDEFHTYMDGRSYYYGYDVKRTDEIQLGPGKYTVKAEKVVMDIVVPGDVERTMSWTFDMDGVKHRVSVTYTISIEDYIPVNSDSSAFNEGHKHGVKKFYELVGQVLVDDTVLQVESRMAAEYERIGGSTDDRQGYADFIASAVQLAVDYPQRVDSSTDKYVWGVNEYWCTPVETLYHLIGDCDDTSILVCALYKAAGYRAAVGGDNGHVFAGVHLDSFEEVPRDRLDALGVGSQMEKSFACGVAEIGRDGRDAKLSDEVFYTVETVFDQVPVGYFGGGNTHLNQYTHLWGWAGFYTEDTAVV